MLLQSAPKIWTRDADDFHALLIDSDDLVQSIQLHVHDIEKGSAEVDNGCVGHVLTEDLAIIDLKVTTLLIRSLGF